MAEMLARDGLVSSEERRASSESTTNGLVVKVTVMANWGDVSHVLAAVSLMIDL